MLFFEETASHVAKIFSRKVSNLLKLCSSKPFFRHFIKVFFYWNSNLMRKFIFYAFCGDLFHIKWIRFQSFTPHKFCPFLFNFVRNSYSDFLIFRDIFLRFLTIFWGLCNDFYISVKDLFSAIFHFLLYLLSDFYFWNGSCYYRD